MSVKKTVLTGVVAGLIATAHAEFETAYFRGNVDHTGSFPAQSGTAPKGLKWKYQTGGAVVSSPVLSGGQVFIGSLDGSVYALDAISGSEVWKVAVGAPVSGSAAVADGTVYIASENGHLYALNATNGAVQWNVTMTSKHPAGSPVVYGDRVYISMGGPGSYNTIAGYTDKAAGFSRADGSKVWESSSTAAQGFESPIIYSNTLISSSGRESYAAYSLTNGGAIWTQSRQDSYGSQFACAALASNRLFVVGSIAGSLHAIHPETGARLWTAFVDPQQGRITGGGDPGNAVLTSPAVSGSRVFIGSNNGKFICFAAEDGARLWEQDFGNKIQSSAAVADGVVYFGCHDGKLHAVNETNGVELWTYDTGTRIISSPWVASNVVYFGCDDGALYCLESVVDTDGDGIPDAWETQYFGGPTNANPAAIASNGINTVLQCYIAGISPIDPSAAFLISNLEPRIPHPVLQWQNVSGRLYNIYWTSNLLNGFNEVLHSNMTGGAFTDSLHGAEQTGFYRLEVQLEP